MKKLYFLLFTILISATSFGQTTVFSESFETDGNGTRYNQSVLCNDGTGDFFTRTDGSDIASFYEVSGQDGNFFFAAMDIDATECGTSDTETIEFTGINISTFNDLTLIIAAAEDDDGPVNQDWDANTSVLVEINIDGAGYNTLIQFSGGGATNTEPGLDTNFDGTADSTLLSASFQDFQAPLNATGTSADLRISFNNLDAGDEDLAIDNIRIIDSFTATPTITITGPTNGNVFAPGTTNVDLTWTTANLAGNEFVNVIVNMGSPSSVAPTATPFGITTTDGTSYDVTVELRDMGNMLLDSQMTSFSVGSLNTVTDITALKADVTANGLGRFYEITGASLVTHTDGFRNRRWIEDSNMSGISGILIYDDADIITTAYTPGDLVTGLRGTTEESNGVLRFIPTSDAGVIQSAGNPVNPQTVTITALNAAPDDYESELIQIDDVTFVEGDGVATFSTGTNYTLTDAGMNNLTKRTDFFGADYIGEIIPDTQLASVTGVAGEFNGTAQIYVRNLNDLVLSNEGFQLNKFSIYPNPTNTGEVKISSVNASPITVNVFDVLGKQVKNETISNNRLDVSNLKSGIYLLRITQDGATSTKKLVIR